MTDLAEAAIERLTSQVRALQIELEDTKEELEVALQTRGAMRGVVLIHLDQLEERIKRLKDDLNA